MTIIRNPTAEELKDFLPLIQKKKKKPAQELFIEILNNKEQIALKKGLPFARIVAMDNWKEHYQDQAKALMKADGFVDIEKIKIIEMDWNKYSDLKNFKTIDEGEKYDTNLSNKNPGLSVEVKWTIYRFKGYSNTYRVMESGPSAIKRAEGRRAELTQSFKEDKIKNQS